MIPYLQSADFHRTHRYTASLNRERGFRQVSGETVLDRLNSCIYTKKVLHSYECNTFFGRNATPTIGMQHINTKFFLYLCPKI